MEKEQKKEELSKKTAKQTNNATSKKSTVNAKNSKNAKASTTKKTESHENKSTNKKANAKKTEIESNKKSKKIEEKSDKNSKIIEKNTKNGKTKNNQPEKEVSLEANPKSNVVKSATPNKRSKKKKSEKNEKIKTPKKKNEEKKTATKTELTNEDIDHSGTFVWVEGFHNLPIYTMIYDKVISPKAVVLIIHGMQEHCQRYDSFAKFLNTNGYIVVTSDLRGHGRTMKDKSEYGHGEKDIFSECVKDQLCILQQIRGTWNLPIYLFGHSFGSFVSQSLIQQTNEIEKVVLCGSTNGGCAIFKMGSALLSLMKPFQKNDKRGGLAEKLCVKNFGKKFERGNWLSRDEAVFDKYQADEFCGGSFPFSFYYSMIKNMTKVNRGINKIGAKKLLLIAGTNDPVSQNSKQVKKLHKLLLKSNVDAKIKLYENARHELINEINREEVYKDVLNFFDN